MAAAGPNVSLWLCIDTDTVELAVKTLSSHLITRESDSPTESLRTPYVRVEPHSSPLLLQQ
eukprot:508009-Pyramimonas_sp.AAC.1